MSLDEFAFVMPEWYGGKRSSDSKSCTEHGVVERCPVGTGNTIPSILHNIMWGQREQGQGLRGRNPLEEIYR